MAYIKKLVMTGFKSFAKRTEIVFDKGINVILGPNGSGKSNVSDALCFVLGRLSIKSMRAAKAKNLLFMGSKYVKPAREATVELVFDNSDHIFSIDKEEVTIKRSVRINGQSIYKINDETKTRVEIIEMLAQAGIDPHGFNLVLQGQIQAIVNMQPEERRKIIEEVAGISIYESKKEKSLHELEKADEKLKQVAGILRERTSYLKNLDRERSQALRFKELELTIKRVKASIAQRRLEEKNRDVEATEKSIKGWEEKRDKIKIEIDKDRSEIDKLSEKITQIGKYIQQATGFEQETLHTQVANLKAEIEGQKVRKENFEHRCREIERRIGELSSQIPVMEEEIKQLKQKSPIMAKKVQELKKKRDELAVIEEERRKALTFRTELNALRERIKDKERQLTRNGVDSEFILKQLEDYSIGLLYTGEEECAKALSDLREELKKKREEVNKSHEQELSHSRILSVCESEIRRLEKIIADVQKIDVCPLCQSKITVDHISHVNNDCQEKIENFRKNQLHSQQEISALINAKEKLRGEIQTTDEKISALEREYIRHKTIKDKKDQLRKVLEQEKVIKEEIRVFEEKIKNLEARSGEFSLKDEQYHAKLLEIEEINSRTEDDTDTKLLYSQRELDKIHFVLKQQKEDIKEVSTDVQTITKTLAEKTKVLAEKELQEKALNEKFNKMFEERDRLQKDIQTKNLKISEDQTQMRNIEEQANLLRIGKAKLDAEKETIEYELKQYPDVEFIQGSIKVLEERLIKSQDAMGQIGPINMRALEVYDQMKKEYDEIQEKANTLEKEKIEIMHIIEEIDVKKKRSFMRTYRAMNELFTRNFSQLYTKGVAFLELENKENIFEGGVSIVIKVQKGKYMDVKSLSGGEQTLVALSLLFAIQEHKPYQFYIFDEIDAALDKRNSERLSGLLQQYMKSGQYIVVTHNDAIILQSNVLYGVSMHEGVSKVLSLKV